MAGRLRITSIWRWTILLAGVLCAVLVAHPMTARAAGATPDEIAVMGTDGALWAEGSGGWFSLGGVLLDAPAVASIPNPDGIDYGSPILVATGTDHRLWVRDLSHSWQVLANGYCVGSPAAAVVSAHAAGQHLLVAACEGSDNALWYGEEPVSYGTLPGTLPGMQSVGGVLNAGPALAAVNPQGAGGVDAELTFFALGTDQHIWTRTLASGWQQMQWQCIGPPAASTSLSSITPGPTQITMFACTGLDRRLWFAKNTGSGWTPAQGILGGTLFGGPGVAVEPQWANYFGEGTDFGLWEASTSHGGNALGWSSLGGRTFFGAAAAALLKLGDNP